MLAPPSREASDSQASGSAGKRSAAGLRFASQEQEQRLEREGGFIKTAGNPANPLRWPTYLKSLVRGSPEFTVGTRALSKNRRACGEPFVIDGFDDIANAIQATGISRELASTLQLFLFYPPVLALINLGATESRHEFRHSRKTYREARQAVDAARQALTDQAEKIDPALAKTLRTAGSHAEFCARLVGTLKSTLEHAPTTARHAIADYLRMMAAYKNAVDNLPLQQLHSQSSTALVTAAHGMLAGALLYQGTSAAQLATGTGAHIAAGVLSGAGTVTMGVAQIAMAIYGGMQAAQGIKAHRRLHDIKSSIAACPWLSEDTKADLLSIKSRQILVNAIGKIGAPLGLSAGQLMMLLGTTIVGAPALVIGVIMTVAAIGIKLGAQRYHERNFSFDPSAFDISKLAGANSLKEAIPLLETEREPAITDIAWLNILREADKLNHRSGKEAGGNDIQRLQTRCSRLLTADHERSQRQAMHRILNDRQYADILRECLDSSCHGVGSFASLVIGGAAKPLDTMTVLSRINTYKQATRSQRMASLFKHVRSAGLETQVMQHIVEQLVVKENRRANRKGKKYQDFLDRETVIQERRILWDKTKTVYRFKPEALFNTLAKSDDDPIANHVEEVAYQAIEKVVASEYLYKKRSRLLATDELICQFAVLEKASDVTTNTRTVTGNIAGGVV